MSTTASAALMVLGLIVIGAVQAYCDEPLGQEAVSVGESGTQPVGTGANDQEDVQRDDARPISETKEGNQWRTTD